MLDDVDCIAQLSEARRQGHDGEAEIELARCRHRAFAELDERSAHDDWPPVAEPRVFDHVGPLAALPPADLTGGAIAAAIVQHGALLVPELIDAGAVERLVEGIDRAFAARGDYGPMRAHRPGDPSTCWYEPLPVDAEAQAGLGRQWVADGGGLLLCDSPHLLADVLELYTRIGLRDAVEQFLGERPVLSANKCTLRRVALDAIGGWHQDGAFLGSGIRAVNVWLTLTDCGQDAPGLDVVPRRFDHVVETGTDGSLFDWAVGPEKVQAVSGSTPPVRPPFRAGDALIFDDLFLHRTAVHPAMTRERHAVELWCFGSSAYPKGQLPLVW